MGNAKFKRGDLVVFMKGQYEGRKGIVTDPWWQISQSDWPCVEVQFTDETFGYGQDEEIELVEDPYEFAVQRFFGRAPRQVKPEEWTTLDVATVQLCALGLKGTDPTWGDWTAKLVKRRKAGRIEDV
jgi:hypothetical protein